LPRFFDFLRCAVSTIGTVDSLWRYPVKSMRGEEMDEMFVGYAGVYGDRLFAFVSDRNAKGFPYFTGRDQRQMIRYRARFRGNAAAAPSNRREAEENGAWSLPAAAAPLTVDVETPDGEVFAIDDSALIDSLCARLEPSHDIRLLRSDRAMTDCAPVSVFSLQTVRQLEKESGVAVDKRQFRAIAAPRLAGCRCAYETGWTLHDDHSRSGNGGEIASAAEGNRAKT
jgi:hypothetical protein